MSMYLTRSHIALFRVEELPSLFEYNCTCVTMIVATMPPIIKTHPPTVPGRVPTTYSSYHAWYDFVHYMYMYTMVEEKSQEKGHTRDPSVMRGIVLLTLCGGVAAFNLPLRTVTRAASVTLPSVQMGFEVESVTEQAVGEMGVAAWPGLEKRAAPFSQSAGSDEMMMIYVREGSATVKDADAESTVNAGQMVMLSDGNLEWSAIGEGGVTLLTTTAPLTDVVNDGMELKVLPNTQVEEEEVKDISIKEAGILFVAGVAAAQLGAFGFSLFTSSG